MHTLLQAILALLSEQWIIVSNLPGSPDLQTNETTAWPIVNYEPCTSIGTKHFWLPARFGTFKSNGASHISYHYGETGLIYKLHQVGQLTSKHHELGYSLLRKVFLNYGFEWTLPITKINSKIEIKSHFSASRLYYPIGR